MSEPRARAAGVEPVVPGVLHWSIHDERIDFRSDAYAVTSHDGTVLIDPLPLEDGALGALGRVSAICLTGAFHQRAAWSLRRRFGAPVFAPRAGRGLEHAPDTGYRDGDRLPGGLLALRRPGPTAPHFVFSLHRRPGGAVLFLADLLMREDDGPFVFVPDEHQDDPAATRDSVRDLAGRDVEVLCPAHGAPQVGGAREALLAALRRDAPGSSG